LRATAKWSNGDPVTAGDFVFSLRRVEDPRTIAREAEVLYPIKNAEEVNIGKLDVTALGVAAPDERTVEITLKAPTPYFLRLLLMKQAMPVHEKTVRLGEDWGMPGRIVSNGAYMLEDWKPFSHVRLVKNPLYWNAGKVAIDAVEFDPTDNLATVLKRYRASEFDIIINGLPSDQLGWIKQNLPKELHLAPFANVIYYVVNTARPPFNDQRVRQALAMAVNREVLVEKVRRGGELPAWCRSRRHRQLHLAESELGQHEPGRPRRGGHQAHERGGLRPAHAAQCATHLRHVGEPQTDRHCDRGDVEEARRQCRGQGARGQYASGRFRGRTCRVERRL
jgi:oligopeptide transport system substrate-binding protein